MRAIAFLLLAGCGGQPHIEKCHPDFGSVAGGDDIKVLGAGFSAGLTVRMGGKSARVVSVTPEAIEVQTPPNTATGPVDVEVVTSDGTALLKRAAFRYVEEGQNPVE
jgi:hypothetical protein